MSICANGILVSCNSGTSTGARSLISDQVPDQFPLYLPIEADLDMFRNLGFGAPVSPIWRTCSQIGASDALLFIYVIVLSQESNTCLYLEIILVAYQLKSDLIIISNLRHHASSSPVTSSIICHPHSFIYHCHRSCITCE